MNTSRLFFYVLKIYLKKPAMILLLCVIPLLTILSTSFESNTPEALQAAVYIECTPEDSFVKETFLNALSDYQGQIRFIVYETSEEMKHAVINRSAECGYILPIDLYSRIINDEGDEMIYVYYAPSTTLMPLINESLYSILYSEVSKTALTDYLFQQSVLQNEISEQYTIENISALYEEYLHNGTTFRFEQTKLSVSDSVSGIQFSLSSSLRGIFAVLILLSAFLGLLDYYRYPKNIIYQFKTVRLILIMVPTLLTALTVLLCLNFTAVHVFFLKELLCLSLYAVSCILLTLLLSFCIRTASFFYAFLPIYIICNAVFCPIFMDLLALLPLFRIISYLFLPGYYLQWF